MPAATATGATTYGPCFDPIVRGLSSTCLTMWYTTYIVRYGVDRLMDYTGYLLRTAFLRSRTIAAREFGADAHPRDVGVLATLQAAGPLSQQELALRLNVNRTVMVKLIDGLEARGYVERVRNPEDRRAYALHATSAGLESLAGRCRGCCAPSPS